MRRTAVLVSCGLALGAVALPAFIAQSQTKSTANYRPTVDTTAGSKSWKPVWTAKVRLLSTGSAIVSGGQGGVTLPSIPAVSLPPGITLPPGLTLPPGATIPGASG